MTMLIVLRHERFEKVFGKGDVLMSGLIYLNEILLVYGIRLK